MEPEEEAKPDMKWLVAPEKHICWGVGTMQAGVGKCGLEKDDKWCGWGFQGGKMFLLAANDEHADSLGSQLL